MFFESFQIIVPPSIQPESFNFPFMHGRRTNNIHAVLFAAKILEIYKKWI
jgi:hypothetical protein